MTKHTIHLRRRLAKAIAAGLITEADIVRFCNVHATTIMRVVREDQEPKYNLGKDLEVLLKRVNNEEGD